MLKMDVDRFDEDLLDHFESQPATRNEIEKDYSKWKQSYKRLELLRKVTDQASMAGAGRGRGKGGKA